MGKRQHQKDKMYLTYTEWTTLYGGKRSGTSKEEDTSFKRLPFDHCCLCLQPFEEPFCDLDGNVFELEAVANFVKKFKCNPVTGKKFDVKSLIKLTFRKNSEDVYHCPVLFKPFTKNSHIVAIRTTGHVYSYEAVEELNIKGKNWKDLIDDTPFVRADIITIQDPNNLSKFNIPTFHHVKNNLRVETEEEIAMRKDPHARLKTVSAETKDILTELEREYKAPEKKENKKEVADKFNAAHYSTGMVAASFTSTAMVPETVHEAAIICEDEVIYDKIKKKGYVRLLTNYGPLNFELYCEVTPKACHNFIKLCNNGYYNGTKFHRSIKNFMIQGGDPTGTGLGGESIWKKPFEDEIRPNLHHTGRGILSMANSGPNTNGSQFFITFRSCKQLDGKHTIFGKVVGGLDTLNLIEQIEVDNRDRPVLDIVIEAAQVFVDPFAEAEEQVQWQKRSSSKEIRSVSPLKRRRRSRSHERRSPKWHFNREAMRRSRSPQHRSNEFRTHQHRNQSPEFRTHRHRNRSPEFRIKRSRSPKARIRRSRSPQFHMKRSNSPFRRKRSVSPLRKVMRSPQGRRVRSRSPMPGVKLSRSRSPRGDSPSRCPSPNRQRSRDSIQGHHYDLPNNSTNPPSFIQNNQLPAPTDFAPGLLPTDAQPKNSWMQEVEQFTKKLGFTSDKTLPSAPNSHLLTSASVSYYSHLSGMPPLQTSVPSQNTSVPFSQPILPPSVLAPTLSEPSYEVSRSQKYINSLTEMLGRRNIHGEALEIYYYAKMILLRPCELPGKRAVDCLIGGIDDRDLRSCLEKEELVEPDQVLQFFKFVDKQNSNTHSNTLVCYNCHGLGHPFFKCPNPLLKCSNCQLYGHIEANCTVSDSFSNKSSREKINKDDFSSEVLNNYGIASDNRNDSEFGTKSFNELAPRVPKKKKANFDLQQTEHVQKKKKKIACYNCSGDHPFYKCPQPLLKCTICGLVGHIDTDCSAVNIVENQVDNSIHDGNTFIQSGNMNDDLLHTATVFPNVDPSARSVPIKIIEPICFKCNIKGHKYHKCPQRRIIRIYCSKCKKVGHTDVDCLENDNFENKTTDDNVEAPEELDTTRDSADNNSGIDYSSQAPTKSKKFCTKCLTEGHNRRKCNFLYSKGTTVDQDSSASHETHVQTSKKPCYNCHTVGHRYTQCPKPIIKCSQCNHVGHTDADCQVNEQGLADSSSKTGDNNEEALTDSKKNMREVKCYNCGERGHIKLKCPLKGFCNNCQIFGHSARKCTEPILESASCLFWST